MTGDGASGATYDPFGHAQLGPIVLPNRIVKAATFEGMAPENVVTEQLIDFHRAVPRAASA